MSKPNFSFEKKYWRKGYPVVIGVDEVGRGAFAGPVVAGAVGLKIKNREFRIKDNKSKLASCFLLLNSISRLGIDDSKKLTPGKRKKLAVKIKKYFYWGIGETSVGHINRLGIIKATEKAMRMAIKVLIVKSTKFEYPLRHSFSEASRNSKQYQNSNFQNPKQNNFGFRISDFGFPKQTSFVLIDAFHIKYIPGIGLKNQKAIVYGDQRSISIAAASILAKVYRDTLMQKLSLRYKKYHWKENKGYGTKKHREAIRKYGVTKLHRKGFVKNWL